MKCVRKHVEELMVADGSHNRPMMRWTLALLLAVVVVMLGGCVESPGISSSREPVFRAPALRIPAFPWPPPHASAETVIPNKWLPPTENAQLADVADNLERALYAAKYPRWSYSSVPDGFALVCQMEQIKPDGTPSPEPARWSAEMRWVSDLTLVEFIKALANAQPGYYRVIVFIVTDKPWSRTSGKPTAEEAEQWLAVGFTRLPEDIGGLSYGRAYRTTALVYEFKKVSKDASATLLENSRTRADRHLEKAGISDPLSRR